MYEKMDYFKAIEHVSNLLTQEAGKELDSTKEFHQKLLDTSNALSNAQDDYTFMESLGVKFLDTIAMDTLYQGIEKDQKALIAECDRVVKHGEIRKDQLRKAVIWGKF